MLLVPSAHDACVAGLSAPFNRPNGEPVVGCTDQLTGRPRLYGLSWPQTIDADKPDPFGANSSILSCLLLSQCKAGGCITIAGQYSEIIAVKLMQPQKPLGRFFRSCSCSFSIIPIGQPNL